MRETSVDAFHHIAWDGTLNKMQRKVYLYLLENGPMTGGELDDRLSKGQAKRGNYHKRLSELERMNAVRELKRRKCNITKRESIVWEATSGPFKKLPSRKSKVTQYRERMLSLADYLEFEHDKSGRTSKQIADFIRSDVKKIG